MTILEFSDFVRYRAELIGVRVDRVSTISDTETGLPEIIGYRIDMRGNSGWVEFDVELTAAPERVLVDVVDHELARFKRLAAVT